MVSGCIKEVDDHESTLGKDPMILRMHRDLSDLGSLILIQNIYPKGMNPNMVRLKVQIDLTKL